MTPELPCKRLRNEGKLAKKKGVGMVLPQAVWWDCLGTPEAPRYRTSASLHVFVVHYFKGFLKEIGLACIVRMNSSPCSRRSGKETISANGRSWRETVGGVATQLRKKGG